MRYMKYFINFTLLVILILPAFEAEAKKVRLHCSEGYSITVKFTLRASLDQLLDTDVGETPNFESGTISCPPDAVVDIGDFDYDGIQAEWDITAPDGSQSTGSLPAQPGGGAPTPHDFADWGVHPRSPSSYICNAINCAKDPLAPAFVQEGEFLLGGYVEGSTFDLVIKTIDDNQRQAIKDSLVTVYKVEDGSTVATGQTDASGKLRINVPAGEKLSIKVTNSDYSPQTSDHFYMYEPHAWTMVLTKDMKQPSSLWTTAGIILAIIILMFLIRRRRSTL